MKETMLFKIFTLFAVFFPIILIATYSQEHKDYALAVDVEITEYSEITANILWDIDMETKEYIIRRKLLEQNDWDTLAVLDKDQTSYIDKNLADGTEYDYGIIKVKEDYNAFSFFAVGVNIPPRVNKGTVLLLIDETVAENLDFELERFESDIIGDGWSVVRRYVSRTEEFDSLAVQNIRKTIAAVYHADSSLKTLILFGRIAVPYSGAYSIDGHFPEHYGAWPADVYYAAPDAIWTDSTVNAYSALREENFNLIEDGKFDETTVDGKVLLNIGRIDFFNLPAFTQSEVELLSRYLDKNHAFRYGKIKVNHKALIDDRLRFSQEEPYSAGAWNNFYALFGKENIDTLDYRNNMESSSYLWSYGSNTGSFSSVAHVAYATEFADRKANGIFTSFTGSWFPDWDSPDNLLRSAIASSPSILACFFDGLPNWHYHNMALGRTIAYATKLTQNNRDLFRANETDGFRQIHIALMGDPTLRMIYREPPTNFGISDTIVHNGQEVIVLKHTEVDDCLGYNLYVKNKHSNLYSLYKFFVGDTCHFPKQDFENFDFMLKSVRLEEVKGGTYFNESQGTFLYTENTNSIKNIINSNNPLKISPNPANDQIAVYYSSEETERIRIDVLDIQGNVIRKVYDGIYFPGKHKIIWELTDSYENKVPSGVYYIRLTYGYNVNVAKLIVIY